MAAGHLGRSETITMIEGGCLGEPVIEYRRGVIKRAMGKLWHFHDQCLGYPTQTFAIRKDKPSDDELCARCQALSQKR